MSKELSENQLSDKKGIAGSVSYVMIVMVLSRLLSLVSRQVYMSVFGLDGDINIYTYATTIPNTIFNCFGTALSTVFIPIYAGHIARGEKKAADRFANNIITISAVFTAALVVLGIAVSPVLPKFTAFDSGHDYSFAVKSLMIMMPIMLFYALGYILQGVLQTKGKYFWPAFVSVPSSLAVIVYVFAFGDKYGVSGLLAATFLGLALQALILIPPAIFLGFRYKPSFEIKSPDVITAAKMTGPVLLGSSAYQINVFFNTSMISNFEGMVTLTSYVQLLVVDMTLAIIYSVTAVVYPKLTASASTNDFDNYKQTLRGVLSTMTFILMPMTFGLIAVREPLLMLIANYGKITADDIGKACIMLVLYSVGILGVGLKELLDRAFFAVKETLIPAVNGFIIMAVNIILSLVLSKFFGAYGIPLAYSAAALSGLCVLLYLLKKKIGKYGNGLVLNFVKSLSASVLMLVSVRAVMRVLDEMIATDSIGTRIVKLGVPVVSGVIMYIAVSVILKNDAVTAVFAAAKSKISRLR